MKEHSSQPLTVRHRSSLIALVVSHPRWLILAVLALTALACYGLRNGLELDVSPLTFIEKTADSAPILKPPARVSATISIW